MPARSIRRHPGRHPARLRQRLPLTAYVFVRVERRRARPRVAAGAAGPGHHRRAVARRQARDDAERRRHVRAASRPSACRARSSTRSRTSSAQGMAARASVLGDTGRATRRAGTAGSARARPTCSRPSTRSDAERLDAALGELRAGIEQRGGLTIAYEQDHPPARGRPRALRLRRRLRAAGDRAGSSEERARGRRRPREGRALAPARAGRVHPRLRGRGRA